MIALDTPPSKSTEKVASRASDKRAASTRKVEPVDMITHNIKNLLGGIISGGDMLEGQLKGLPQEARAVLESLADTGSILYINQWLYESEVSQVSEERDALKARLANNEFLNSGRIQPDEASDEYGDIKFYLKKTLPLLLRYLDKKDYAMVAKISTQCIHSKKLDCYSDLKGAFCHLQEASSRQINENSHDDARKQFKNCLQGLNEVVGYLKILNQM